MRKQGARFLCLLLILSLLSGCGGGGKLRLPEPPANGCVLDMAGVLEPDAAAWVSEQNKTLSAVGAKITVVTVDVLGGKSAGEYAAGVFDAWDVAGEMGNGLLLLLAIQDGEYHLIQGSSIAGDLTDEILADYAWNYLERDFAAGDYAAGARRLLEALFRWYREHYAVELGLAQPEADAPDDAAGGGFPWLAVVIVIAAVVLVALVAVKLRKAGGPNRPSRRRVNRYHGSRRRK